MPCDGIRCCCIRVVAVKGKGSSYQY
jgi:hypothetical protein